jgi:hypothetical protein
MRTDVQAPIMKPTLTPILRVGVAFLVVGCSTDTTPHRSRSARAPADAPPSMTQPAMAGTSGSFGNAPPMMPGAGIAGAPPAMPTPRANCEGGRYVGRYNCSLDVIGIPSTLDGDVSFVLEIDETIVPGQCDEFCPDLVIAEGSGTLFGVAGDTGWAFQGELDGGLNCQTGEFRATAANGIFGLAGSTDPSKPDELTTVLDPPLGAFDGTFSGMHGAGPPERITGNWDLAEVADFARCTGPFMVQLQP